MEQERLYRLSIPGIVFFGSLLIFYLITGGSYLPVYNLLKNSTITLFIAIIISVPALGLIISSITLGIISIRFGYKYYLNTPLKKDLIQKILISTDPLFKKLEGKVNNHLLGEFYNKYQAFIRAKAKDETLKFLQRRWNFIWIHANNITAIFLSVIFLPFLTYPSDNTEFKKSF